MKTKLSDLNNHLFDVLERLNSAETPEEMSTEISRARAVTGVAHAIIANGQLALDAKRHVDEYGISKKELPDILSLETK